MGVRFAELSWSEVEDIIRKPNALVIPMGAIEQHGHHLPLNVDSLLATYVSEKAAIKVNEQTGISVLVAPCLNYTETAGFSFPLSGYPGTVGVSVDTITRVIEDIVEGFLAMGFTNIVIVNGHYSNARIIPVALQKVHIDHPEAGLYALNYWSLATDVIAGVRRSDMSHHADELETSMMLVVKPEKVRLDKASKWEPKFSLSRKFAFPDLLGPNKMLFHSRRTMPRRQFGDRTGVMGDSTVAKRETGEQILSAAIDGLTDLLEEIVKSENVDWK